uniref:Uncharacterized protein n=1 Tax=Oryza sativa subsp. japonica TaxID=39947 RepID=Q5W6L5_ORYSJ|nr:hypothetical protein [Oryza sativa Japonica Group]
MASYIKIKIKRQYILEPVTELQPFHGVNGQQDPATPVPGRTTAKVLDRQSCVPVHCGTSAGEGHEGQPRSLRREAAMPRAQLATSISRHTTSARDRITYLPQLHGFKNQYGCYKAHGSAVWCDAAGRRLAAHRPSGGGNGAAQTGPRCPSSPTLSAPTTAPDRQCRPVLLQLYGLEGARSLAVNNWSLNNHGGLSSNAPNPSALRKGQMLLKTRSDDTPVWKTICGVVESVSASTKVSVGNGQSVQFWRDHWTEAVSRQAQLELQFLMDTLADHQLQHERPDERAFILTSAGTTTAAAYNLHTYQYHGTL